MTPQELKNSILQLAIQGKLVEQRPEEGTAEELYQQIQAEKQILIKAGIIKAQKPLPEIAEDEIPFDITDSWKWVRLSSIGITQTGNTPSKAYPEYTGEDVPFITPGDILNGNIAYDNQALSTLGKLVARVCCAGTVLQVCIGGSIGKAAITDREVAFNQQINSISPICCDSQYIFAVMTSQYFVIKMKESAGGTATPIINRGIWDTLLIPLPPLSEQKRIVAKIEELLPYIDRYEKAWSKLEDLNKRFPTDMQKSILQTAIQGKLVEQRPEEGTGEELYKQIQAEKQRLIKEGKIKKEKPLPEITEDEIPFDIPEAWKWVRLNSIVTLNPKNYIADDTEVGFIPMPCVSDGFRNQHTFETKKWKDIKSGFTHFANNDIGVAKITPCFQNRKSVIFNDLPNGFGAGTTELSVIRVINDSLCREYLLWFFKTDYFIANGIKSFTGTAGQQRLHKDYLSTCLLPLPPLAEQKRIVAKLEEILPLCEKLKK